MSSYIEDTTLGIEELEERIAPGVTVLHPPKVDDDGTVLKPGKLSGDKADHGNHDFGGRPPKLVGNGKILIYFG